MNHEIHEKHEMETFKGEMLLYQADDGRIRLDVRLQDETVWLTQANLAGLFQVKPQNITMHLKNIYAEGEFRWMRQLVRNSYKFKKKAVVRSSARESSTISTRLFPLDIYATSIDYDPRSDNSRLFFQQVQNKMHRAAHGHTAAELIYQRADAGQANMGVTNHPGNKLLKRDVEVAKDYLNEEELNILNRMVTAYLEMAELQALNRTPMTMQDWIERLHQFSKSRIIRRIKRLTSYDC